MDKPIAKKPFTTATAGISPGGIAFIVLLVYVGSPPLVAGSSVPMQKT